MSSSRNQESKRCGYNQQQVQVIPVNDLQTSENERSRDDVQKCKLASVCRLLEKYNLTFGIFNHTGVRSSSDKSQFYLNPFGLNYDEITASSLVRVDMNGSIKDRGNTKYGVNRAGFVLNAAILDSRPDINCVLHVHTNSCIAVSVLKAGFLPLSQEALITLNNVSYFTYEGMLTDDDLKKSLSKSLGSKNKIMVLHNHGIVSCGETVEEAWTNLFTVVYACKTQVDALSCVGGNEKQLIMPDSHAIHQVEKEAKRGLSGLHMGSDLKWNTGELEFEAEMRLLDRNGVRTGYPYKYKPQNIEF